MDEPGDVVGRRVDVGQLAAPGSLGDDPFGFGIAVVPARVIDQVRNHVHHPAGGGSVDGLDAPESAARDQLADFLVMRAIAMLVADNCLDAAFRDQIADLETFGGGQGDGLLHSDELGAALNADADHTGADVGQGAETENVGTRGARDLGGIGSFERYAELGARVIEARLIDVADADNFKTAVGLKGGGMMHAPLAHADDDKAVFVFHPAVLSHSSVLAIT